MLSLAKHVKVRGLSEDDPYWVCGYANNQHQIESEINISADPKKTSFYRAMRQSKGVLLCLDELATPLKTNVRTLVALRQTPRLLDADIGGGEQQIRHGSHEIYGSLVVLAAVLVLTDLERHLVRGGLVVAGSGRYR